jgi:DDE superfamily endonuclease
MLAAARAAGLPAGFMAADGAYGNDGGFRAGVRALGYGYVLAVPRSHGIALPGGIRRRADRIAADLPARTWAALQRKTRVQGATPVRLGLDPRRRTPRTRRSPDRGRPADPPQQRHRRTGLLPRLPPAPGRVARPGARRRNPPGDPGIVPGHERPGRTRPLPGTQLEGTAPVHRPGHDRPRPAGPDRRTPTRTGRRSDPADRTRDPQAHQRPAQHHAAGPEAPSTLVSVAQTPPGHRTPRPLPPPHGHTAPGRSSAGVRRPGPCACGRRPGRS